MLDPLDTLDLADGKRLAIVADGDALAAIPAVRDASGGWRRAHAGDGAAEALLNVLANQAGNVANGRFTIHSWEQRTALGEKAIDVDQTNESVIVGDAAVVKWATHMQEGPHPAPRRIEVLREAGFHGMPTPWGLVTWRPTDGEATLVASVDEYLSGAVDGWTWAVEMITAAASDRSPGRAYDTARHVGGLIADLHSALAATTAIASETDAARWRDASLELLETACTSHEFTHARRHAIASVLERLGALAGTSVIEGHGDLHVGQVLRSQERFVVTDFDGNPVLTAAERMRPIPAALDVAGMTQSLAHATIVAAKYTDLEPETLSGVDLRVRRAFLDSYTARIAELGHAELFDAAALFPFRVQQVLREIVYATKHLPRWMYVPDAALPALLDEGDLL